VDQFGSTDGCTFACQAAINYNEPRAPRQWLAKKRQSDWGPKLGPKVRREYSLNQLFAWVAPLKHSSDSAEHPNSRLVEMPSLT